MLAVDTNSYDYRFCKTLNEDVKLVSDGYGKFDLDMDNGDYINVTGVDSLRNACIIAIMTRYNELKKINTYEGFGCKIHDLIKANPTDMVKYNMVLFIEEVLNNMRRIKEVQNITLIEEKNKYKVSFKVIGINDEFVAGSVEI